MSDTESGVDTLPTRNHKWLKRTCLALAALLAIQFGTYLGCARAAMPRAGVTHLGDYRCIRGCEFAAIDKDTWARLDDGQRRDFEGELRRHVSTVYRSRDEIPESLKDYRQLSDDDRKRCEDILKRPELDSKTSAALRKEIESGRREAGLKNGMLFSWKPECRGLFWMKCSSGCYMGEEGAEGGADLFVWILGRWFRVKNYGHEMA